MTRVVLTNDDGIMADGLRALHQATLERGLEVVVVAPADNRSGVARSATYSDPVSLTAAAGTVNVFGCSGTPVDCVRAALLGDVAPDAGLVVSGINHGANLGDDTLNSGTVGAAVEAALLGVPAIAFSQQSHVGFFHILDALDQSAVVYDETAAIAASIIECALSWRPWPDRVVLNVNLPAHVDRASAAVRVTRLGRRFYPRGSVAPERQGVAVGYRTYGDRAGTPPRHEDAPGTDFEAISRGDISITPLSYAWEGEASDELRDWADKACKDAHQSL